MTEPASASPTPAQAAGRLLGAADIRRIAADAGISPTKKFGQNFVIDPGTVRRIVREAGVQPTDHVLEVGPGLGSLTLAILETGARMTAVEIDPPVAERLPRTVAEFMPDAAVLEVGPGLGSLTLAILETGARMTAVEIDPPVAERLPRTVAEFMPDAADRLRVVNADAVEIDPPVAERLPRTVAEFMPDAADRLRVVNADALTLTPQSLPDFNGDDRFVLVANLPYNVATPIVLTLLERFANLDTFLVMVQKEVADRRFANLDTFLVMVQKEVADRLAAQPGTKIYGTPSVKLAWYGTAQTVGAIGRNVFWPAPNVDSALVLFRRYPAGAAPADRAGVSRETVFRLVDAAFGQRRKTLHAALKKIVPPEAYDRAGIDATRRGETLSIDEFVQLAAAATRRGETLSIDEFVQLAAALGEARA